MTKYKEIKKFPAEQSRTLTGIKHETFVTMVGCLVLAQNAGTEKQVERAISYRG